MSKAKITYGQLDKALRSLGFLCRIDKASPPARVYTHEQSGAILLLPPLPMRNRVYEHHLHTVRITLENFGIPTPAIFDRPLQKAS